MSNYNVSVKFNAQTGKFNSDVKGAAKGIDQLSGSTKRASTSNNQFASSADNANNKMAVTNKLAQTVTRSLIGMAAGFGAFQIGSSLTRNLAEFQDIRTRLQGLSADAADYADKEAWLIDLAKRHHKELTGLGDGYSRLSTLVNENIVSDEAARSMLEGLSNAASANGANAEDLGRVYYGLSQALGAGVVNMEDFRQVTEPLPDLMAKVAKIAGHDTSAGLKKMIGDGELTSEVFGTMLVKALGQYEGKAAAMGDNINAKFADIKTQYTLLAKALEVPINSVLLPGLDGTAEGLEFLSKHVEEVITVMQIGLVTAAGLATGAIYNKTAATARDIIISRQAAQADIILAQTEIKRATAARAAALGAGQATAAEIRLTAARNQLTAATTRLNVVSRAATGLVGALGGLPGILAIAAFSLFTFSGSSDDAAGSAAELKGEIDQLGESFKTLTLAQLKAKEIDLAQSIANQQDEVKSLNNQILTLGHTSKGYYDKELKRWVELPTQTKAGADKIIKAEAAKETAVIELNKQLELQKNLLTQLGHLEAGGEPDKAAKPKAAVTETPQTDKELKAFNDRAAGYREQIALMGQTTELARAQYEVENGKYINLEPAQKSELLRLAKAADKKAQLIDLDKEASKSAKELTTTAQSYAQNLAKTSLLSSDASEVQKLNYEIEHGKLQGINDLLREKLTLLAEQADATVALEEAQLPFWEALEQHISDSTTNFDAMWGSTFNNFAQGIGDAVGTAVVEGENFNDAMRNITKSVIKELISGFVQIGVKKLALAAIEKSIAVSGAATSTATGVATATALGTAYAVPAALASLMSFGSNSAPAMAGLTATVGLSEGFALAGMAHDGIDNVPREGTWLLDKGERVVDSRTNADLKGFLGKKTGNSTNNANVNLTIQAPDDSTGAEMILNNRDLIYSLVQDAQNEIGKEF